MSVDQIECGNATVINSATTTLVYTGSGKILGVLFSSGTSPSVAIYDGLSASGTKLVDTTVGSAGLFMRTPTAFATGLTIVTAGTNPVVTVFWAP